FARPGEIKSLPPLDGAPPPLSASAAAVAATLLDYETPVWLDAPLSQRSEVADWIRLQTGARVTADPASSSFAFLADPAHAPAFDVFSSGTAEYPDRSTTLVLQVETLATGTRLSLSGPGIAGTRTLAGAPLPPDFAERFGASRALFPRGIDLILVAPTS